MSDQRVWDRVRQMDYSVGTHVPGLPTAAFDFDSTLRPYRGAGPPTELTLTFLASMSASFNLLIISNRSAATAKALAPIKEYVGELDERSASARRATVYAPAARDRDRKPHTGAWEHYVEHVCGGARPGFAFYCGDAAGRPGDHSPGDYMFAINIGVRFTTPEALFSGDDPWAEPTSYGCSAPLPLELEAGAAEAEPVVPGFMVGLSFVPRPRAVILVGSPASGKSRVAAELVRDGYALVSRDALGPRHQKAYGDALAARRDVVVDNTNPLARDRAYFADLARAKGHAVVVLHVTTPKHLCFHLNAARCQLDRSGATKEVPPVALHTYWKRVEEPTPDEIAALGAYYLRHPFALAPGAPPEVASFRYPLR